MKKIAIAGPFTGSRSDYGIRIKQVAAKFKQHSNLRFSFYDDGADVLTSLKVSASIINDNPDVIIGHFNSYCAIAVKEKYQAANIPLILPASTSPKLSTGNTSSSSR